MYTKSVIQYLNRLRSIDGGSWVADSVLMNHDGFPAYRGLILARYLAFGEDVSNDVYRGRYDTGSRPGRQARCRTDFGRFIAQFTELELRTHEGVSRTKRTKPFIWWGKECPDPEVKWLYVVSQEETLLLKVTVFQKGKGPVFSGSPLEFLEYCEGHYEDAMAHHHDR